MPERPDLEYVVPRLSAELAGARITAVRVEKPVVVRVAVRGAFDALLVGQTFVRAERRGHFVRFVLARGGAETEEMVVAPMLAGRFDLAQQTDKSPRDLAVALALEDGRELRYRDDVQMGKVYVVARGDDRTVPGLANLGIDVLAPEFTRAELGKRAAKRRDQVRVFVMDKTTFDSFGNAYADEVLFEARLHPKRRTGSLTTEELDRLHAAMVHVLQRARDEIRRRAPPLHEKLRDFLAVRGRAGEPCPRCGAKLRRTGVLGYDAIFCPACQPDEGTRAFVSFTALEKGRAPPAEQAPSASGPEAEPPEVQGTIKGKPTRAAESARASAKRPTKKADASDASPEPGARARRAASAEPGARARRARGRMP